MQFASFHVSKVTRFSIFTLEICPETPPTYKLHLHQHILRLTFQIRFNILNCFFSSIRTCFFGCKSDVRSHEDFAVIKTFLIKLIRSIVWRFGVTIDPCASKNTSIKRLQHSTYVICVVADERNKKFHSGIMGKPAAEYSAKDADIRNYAKYLLSHGSLFEKRDLIQCLKSKISIKEKVIYLAN